MKKSHAFLLAAVAALGLLIANAASAQAWPTKPVRLIIPFAAGGASDAFARLIAPVLAERFGQPVVVENKPGAGGTLAADFVAKAPADGYVVLLGDIGTHGIAPSLYPKLPYDAIKDFEAVNLSLMSPLALVISPSVPATNLRELLALAKAKGSQINYASAGKGGISHLAGEMLKSMAAVEITHIPYKGGAPGLADVMGGQVQMMLPSVSTSQSHVKAGKLRAIAVTGSHRSPQLPDVPTMEEAGLAGYVVEPWIGILVAAGTPKAASERLQREMSAVLARPDIRERLTTMGFEVVNGPPARFNELLRAEVQKWDRVVRAAGVQLE